jgi:hypothetical protein
MSYRLGEIIVYMFWSVLISFMFILFDISPLKAAPQNKLPEELEVLEKFLGVWKTQTTIRNEGPPPSEFSHLGEIICQRTLEGRYFECRSKSSPSGQAELQIMTYDIDAGIYRQWVFDSDGYDHEAEGRWDSPSFTIRWQGTAGSTSFVIKDHWVSSDRIEWTLLRTDSDGRQLQTIEGVLIKNRDQ